MKLTILATHPVQYQVPWFRALAARSDIQIGVWFERLPNAETQGLGFGVPFTWDIPLLEGYEWSAPSRQEGRSVGRKLIGVRSLAGEIRNHQPDAVLINGWHTVGMRAGLAVSLALRIPCIIRGESSALQPRGRKANLGYRSVLRWYDAYLAIGESNRQFYLEKGIPDQRIFHARYFIDNARFGKAAAGLEPERDSIRRGWGIEANTTCFLFAGKFQPKKRLLDVIEATRLALGRGADVHLLVVGSGEQESPARAAADPLGGRITFAGFLNQTEIPRAYVAADCLVLPSDYGETWGLVVNEAMACGRPAIVSDRVGCGPDLIREGQTGYAFPYGDTSSLSDVMVSAASNPESLREMGARARSHIQAYSIDAATEGLMAALEYVTEHRSRRGRGGH